MGGDNLMMPDTESVKFLLKQAEAALEWMYHADHDCRTGNDPDDGCTGCHQIEQMEDAVRMVKKELEKGEL